MVLVRQAFVLQLIGISIIVFGSVNMSNGQKPVDDKLEIVQNFKVGKEYRYEVQRGKLDSRQPELENVKSSTEVVFSILSSKDLFKECSWKYGSTRIIGIDPDQIDEQTNKMINLYEGIQVKFLVDNAGKIYEILNFEECKIYIEEATRLVYDNAPNGVTLEQREKIRSTLEKTYETPEMLISTYCPELAVFFTMFGETIKMDSLYVSQSTLPNPFGGRSFPTNVTTKIESFIDFIATISIEQKIPERDLNEIMKETFIALSKNSEKPFAESEIPTINITTKSIFSFDSRNNILKEVSAEKVIEADKIKQIQTLKVILKS